MLYETLFQAKIFLSIMYFGIVSGLFYEMFHLFKFKNQVILFVLDFIFMLIFSALYIFSVNIFCFGEFRFYTMPAFILGFLIERKTIGKFVALFFNMLYNSIVKLLKKIKNSKVVLFILNKLKRFNQKLEIKKESKKQKREEIKKAKQNKGLKNKPKKSPKVKFKKKKAVV